MIKHINVFNRKNKRKGKKKRTSELEFDEEEDFDSEDKTKTKTKSVESKPIREGPKRRGRATAANKIGLVVKKEEI